MKMGVRAAGVSTLERLRRMPPWRLDAVLASCFVLTGLTTTNETSPTYKPRDGVAIALILAATLPYYARRVAPLPVFAVSTTAVAALFVNRYPAGALPMVIAVGAYTVGAHRPLYDVVLATAFMNLVFLVMFASHSPDFGGAEFVTSVAVFGATMLAGWTTQSRRLRLDALEREEGEAALRAVSDERLRIAQEVHDVVAHSLGLIAVQAGVGMHVIDTDPAEARRALEHISRTSRSSLAEIRRTLGMVRAGDGRAYAPTPGLADLPRLVQEVGDSGLSVELALALNRVAYPPASGSLPTASCRRHSPTRFVTRTPVVRLCESTSRPAYCTLWSPMTAAGRTVEVGRAGMGWSACGNGWPYTVARSSWARRLTAASGSTLCCPLRGTRSRDPGRRGRRSGPGTRRVLGVARNCR